MTDTLATPLPYDADLLYERVCTSASRLVIAGGSGSGKSTLARRLANRMATDETDSTTILDADPGTPAFGPPGAAARLTSSGESWQLRQLAGLATLDAGRFRLPLVTAVARLIESAPVEGALVLDAPGLHRGTPAIELLPGLTEASDIDTAVVVGSPDREQRLDTALRAAGCKVRFVEPSDEASSASTARRAIQRTEAWEDYLTNASAQLIALADVELTGSHPPIDNREAWTGRQVALLASDGETLAMGEVESLTPRGLEIRAPAFPTDRLAVVLARDARRNDEGRLRTDHGESEADTSTLTSNSPFTLRDSPNERIGLTHPLTARAGLFRAILIAGFFDDPTILVERVQGDEAFLFDLGEVERYPTRVLNKVTNVFVTHAHTDHFAGFVRLLRTRVHLDRACRLFGPPGIADRVESLVRGFTWDRLEEGEGPIFEVGELHGERLRRWRIEAAGPTRTELDPREAPDGRLLEHPRFQVYATTLDHGTDVLAYAIEEHENYAVRSDRLQPPYQPGPWLGELKRKVARDEGEALLELPGGERRPVRELADYLLIRRPGEKLTYATDFGDTPANRRRIVELADGSDIFVCEAFYANAEVDKAEQSGHLTAAACGQIARKAGVGRLIPFHFSSRYADTPEVLYRQVMAEFEAVEVPQLVAERL